MRAMRRLLIGLVLAAAAVPAPQRAAADPRPVQPLAEAGPPPGRVGRVALVAGKVEWRGGSGAAWSDAAVNYPVAAGAAVRTAADARTAIEIGPDSIDLSDGTRIEIATLDDRAIDVALAQGRVALLLPQRSAGSVEIELTQGEVWLQQPGAYQIDVGDGASPRIAVYAGSARLLAGGAEIVVTPSETVELSDLAPTMLRIAPADAAARWWREPGNDGVPSATPTFAAAAMTGFAGLAAAGHWRHTDAYGDVWLPDALPADWAPYRDGHWRWIPPWGWTWIDDEPWGFAPAHYGRWALLPQGWAWLPGSLVTNPIYVPAAVAFLGTPGIGVSYADGNGPAVGWFPLAPGEAYWPSYSSDLDYIRALNRGDVSDLGSIRPQPDGRLPVEVVDWRFANRLSASVVPRPIFIDGRPVPPALLSLPKERLLNMPVVLGSPRIGLPAPPAPPVVAAPARAPPPDPQSGSARAKRAIWLKTVRLATIRSRLYWEGARLRRLAVLHLRAPALGEPPRLRRLVALRRAPHQVTHTKKALR
jgi:hypothetical protein